jgi:hypothetical protein
VWLGHDGLCRAQEWAAVAESVNSHTVHQTNGEQGVGPRLPGFGPQLNGFSVEAVPAPAAAPAEAPIVDVDTAVNTDEPA